MGAAGIIECVLLVLVAAQLGMQPISIQIELLPTDAHQTGAAAFGPETEMAPSLQYVSFFPTTDCWFIKNDKQNLDFNKRQYLS